MIIILYLLALLALGAYSFSQIDLNLTLFQFQPYLDFQYWLTQLGYFNRPLSTAIFLLILAVSNYNILACLLYGKLKPKGK